MGVKNKLYYLARGANLPLHAGMQSLPFESHLSCESMCFSLDKAMIYTRVHWVARTQRDAIQKEEVESLRFTREKCNVLTWDGTQI